MKPLKSFARTALLGIVSSFLILSPNARADLAESLNEQKKFQEELKTLREQAAAKQAEVDRLKANSNVSKGEIAVKEGGKVVGGSGATAEDAVGALLESSAAKDAQKELKKLNDAIGRKTKSLESVEGKITKAINRGEDVEKAKAKAKALRDGGSAKGEDKAKKDADQAKLDKAKEDAEAAKAAETAKARAKKDADTAKAKAEADAKAQAAAQQAKMAKAKKDADDAAKAKAEADARARAVEQAKMAKAKKDADDAKAKKDADAKAQAAADARIAKAKKDADDAKLAKAAADEAKLRAEAIEASNRRAKAIEEYANNPTPENRKKAEAIRKALDDKVAELNDARNDVDKLKGGPGRTPVTVKHARDVLQRIRDAAQDSAKTAAKDTSRSASQDAAQDAGRDASQSAGKDASKDASKDAAKDSGKTASKDASKSAGHDSGKSAAKPGHYHPPGYKGDF